MENSRLREAAPTSVNVTVDRRSREYLTDRKVERLIEAAKQNRSGHRHAIGDKKPFGQFASRVSSDPKRQACELDASHSPNVTAPQALVEVMGQILPR